MSQILKTTLLVIGGGPGGYVAAIRAGQLGIPTVLVEGAALGGTCLNIGCIPSKALIHAAEEYLKARHYAGQSALGIQVQAPSIDIARTVEWKDAIVDRLTSGVAALLKKHGVDVVQGWARILDGKTVEVELAGGGSQRIQCEHLLLAAGSERRAAAPAAGRQGDLLHRGAGAQAACPSAWWWWAAATSAWSWAPPTASSASRWRWWKRSRASCRPTTRN